MSTQQRRSDDFRQVRLETLRTVELQIAAQGGETSADIKLLTQRESIVREIAATDAALSPDNSRAALVKDMNDVQRALYIERIVMDTQTDALEVRKQQEREIVIREQRFQETDAQRATTRNWLMGLTSAVAMLVLDRLRAWWREWRNG